MGSVENTPFLLTFLGMFTFPAGEGKLKKISVRISSIYTAPATAALKKWSDDHFYESAILWGIADIPLCDICGKPVQHCPLFRCVIRVFYRAEKWLKYNA
jgi:hypothetical protein